MYQDEEWRVEEELESVDRVGRSLWAGLVEGLGKKEENLHTVIMRQSVSNPKRVPG
jgi:hypothetical protein